MRQTFPLLQSQMSVAIEWIAHPKTTKYNLPVRLAFPKTIDAERIRMALMRIVEARELLRLQIVLDENGEIRQYVDPEMHIDIPVKKIPEDEARVYVEREFLQPFTPFSSEPMVRFEVVETESNNYLLADLHHIVADGTSFSPLWINRDLVTALKGEQLPTFDYTILQYAEEEQTSFKSESYARAKEYYKEKFSGISFTDISHVKKSAWGNQMICSEFVSAAEVEEWSRANGVTSNMLFMAAYAIVLARFSGEEKVAFCTLNHGRSDRRVREIYGMFVKNTPVIADVLPLKTVKDFVVEQRRELMSAIRFGAYPITHFCRDLNMPLCTVFAFQGGEMLEGLEFEGEYIKATQLPHGLTDEELACMIYTVGNDYEIRLTASDALYSRNQLKSFAKAVSVCVKNIMNNPQQTIAELQIVDDSERASLMKLGEGEVLKYDETTTFVDLFLEQVVKSPDAVAVVDEEGSFTYAELERKSAQYADYYADRRNGCGAEHCFFCVETCRTKDYLARVIGIERAGCTFVPIDTEMPEERRKFIVNDAEGKVCPEGSAYMIYTSGTSGKPKGVVISHSAKANLVRFISKEWRLNEESRICCHSSFAFDASIEDLFPVLTVGGAVYIVPENARRDLNLLHDFICENGITGGCFTTQFGQLLLQNYPDLPMEYLVVGGEKMTHNPCCKPRLINTYGPTEFTVDATYFELEDGKHYDSIPIGRPLPNCSAFVLDRNGNLLPRGIAGELCLSGVQIATEYWQQPELTKEKCVTNADGVRLYKTGDICRWNDDGQLEFVARLDNQVKLRGYRIELAEIERVALDCNGVCQAVAAVKIVNGQESIVLYYKLLAQDNSAEDELKKNLQNVLPSYMLPDHYINVREIPTTNNGKTDYDALPVPECFKAENGAEPTTETEKKLCELFAETLGVEKIFADDDFFLSGGTSLLAIRVVMDAVRIGFKFTYQDLFDNATPQKLAAFVDGKVEKKRQFDIANYDYTAINNLLEKNDFSASDARGKESLGDVLLLGANGFLGIHLLHDLLKDYVSKVVCVVRAEDNAEAYRRLEDSFLDYHAELLDNYRDRVKAVAVDITDNDSFGKLSQLHFDTVINCAANVKHFAKSGEIMSVNYDGVLNILEFCKGRGCRFVQASTISVCGSVGECADETAVLSEKSLFVSQDCSSNEYVLSKFLAERAVLECAAQGMDAKVIRLGNLSPRTTDGRFQTNADANTFMRTFKGFARAKAFPKEMESVPIHFEPIDETAKAFLLLSQTPKDCVLMHCCNDTAACYGEMIKAMRDSGIELDEMNLMDFAARVESLSSEDKTLIMTNIVAYGINTNSLKITVKISSEESNKMLAAMGFRWSETNSDYMVQFVKKLGFIMKPQRHL